MCPTFNRQQCREVDRRSVEQYGLAGIVLMENAGRGVADLMRQLSIDGPVVICCGKGNNGGDGFVVARHLDLHKIDVRVLLWAAPESLRGDAAVNYRILEKAGLRLETLVSAEPETWRRQLEGASWIVDGLLGTGARGEPRPPLDVAIETINQAAARVMALDVPSGLDCDSGAAAVHTVRADHTSTFLAMKPGLVAAGAAAFTGEVHVLDIGAPRKLIDDVARGQ